MLISEEDRRDLKDLFKQAEAAIQLIEPRWEGLAIASVNQLRYAGFHLANACVEDTTEKATDHFVRARRHCLRSIYDAFDGGIIFILTEIARFQKDYRALDVASLVPEYPKIRHAAREAKQLLNTAKENGRGRQMYFKTAGEMYKNLESMNDTLEAARALLNKALTKQNRDAKLYWLRIGLVLMGVFTSIAAAAVLLRPWFL